MVVKLLTLQCIKNYGSVLQTLATEKILGEYFQNVETIQYIRPDAADKNILNQWTKDTSGIKRIIKKIYLYPMAYRYKKVFHSFLNKYIHLTEQKYEKDEDFIQFPVDADAYCVGSDQVWNSNWNQGFLKAMFLEFAPDKAMKFSFCSSFGKTMLDEEEKAEIYPLLNRLQYISVRESTALKVLETIGINKGIHLLDPTLLIPSSFWSEIAAPRLIKDEYVLVYQLNPNQDFDNYTYKFAKRKGLKLVILGMRTRDLKKKGKTLLMPKVEEFLSLIKYAKFVITDSFHGTAFSLNFNRQFITIYPAEFSTRLYSILKWADLLNRRLDDYNNLEIADEEIDYTLINSKLELEQKRARNYLHSVAKECEEGILNGII